MAFPAAYGCGFLWEAEAAVAALVVIAYSGFASVPLVVCHGADSDKRYRHYEGEDVNYGY